MLDATDKSSKGRKLRRQRFKNIVSISDNQYYFVVEVEIFIQQVLIQELKYIYGIFIFNNFRYSYVLVFRATSVDEMTSLSFTVFRLFNTYLCIYAITNDVFLNSNSPALLKQYCM